MVKEQLLNVKISCRSSSGKNKVLVQSLQAKGVKGAVTFVSNIGSLLLFIHYNLGCKQWHIQRSFVQHLQYVFLYRSIHTWYLVLSLIPSLNSNYSLCLTSVQVVVSTS